jgi:hypothetical protein
VKNIASLIAAVVLLSTAGLTSASTLSLGAAAGYNAFVLGNFTESGTDSVGAIAVGGNFALAGNGSFTIASGHDGDNAAIYDLVADNITWNDLTLQPIVDNAAGTTELQDELFDGALPSSSVPEPGTWVLLVAGFGLIAIARRRATGKVSAKN